MEEKSFSGYLTNKLVFIMTVIPFISWLTAFLSTHSLWISLTTLFVIISIILLITLFGKFKEYNRIIKTHKDVNDEHQILLDEKKAIEKNFNLQSKKYRENIDELNLHKQVTHVVLSMIKADTPETKEGKDIIKLLKASTENIIKDSDNNGI